MKRRCEWQFSLQAIFTRRPTQRPFGRYMDSFRLEFIHQSTQLLEWTNRQINACIARAWPGLKQIGLDHVEGVASILKMRHKLYQSCHNPIDLRLPRIRN